MGKSNSPKIVLGGVVLVGLLGAAYWLGVNQGKKGKEKEEIKYSYTVATKVPDDTESEGGDAYEVLKESEEESEETVSKDKSHAQSVVVPSKGKGNKPTSPASKPTPDPLLNVQYKNCIQGRWGYKFKRPTFLDQEKYSTNNDGGTFEDGKGMKLVTYGSWNIFNETIEDFYQKTPSDARSVTYKHLFKKSKSYVKSGYTKDNQVFYMKEAIIGNPDEEKVVTLILYYPASYKNRVDKMIKELFTNFPN